MQEHPVFNEQGTGIVGRPHQVILFNDNQHDMLEVTLQIVRAAGCSWQKATAVMREAHETGRAVVITTHRERCEHVAAILEEIRLGTAIEALA